MKSFFSIIIFIIVIIYHSYGLSCIDDAQSIKISKDLTLMTVEKALKNLTIVDRDEPCRVEITFCYFNQFIEIIFGEAFEPTDLDVNQEVRIDTWIQIADGQTIINPIHIDNIVEFTCDYADECDRQFVFYQLEWLLKANYDQLASIILALLLPDYTKTGKNDVEFF
jgi:hypothetical protein